MITAEDPTVDQHCLFVWDKPDEPIPGHYKIRINGFVMTCAQFFREAQREPRMVKGD